MTDFLLIAITSANVKHEEKSHDIPLKNGKIAVIRKIEEHAQNFVEGNESINFGQFLMRVMKKYEQLYQTNKITLITY